MSFNLWNEELWRGSRRWRQQFIQFPTVSKLIPIRFHFATHTPSTPSTLQPLLHVCLTVPPETELCSPVVNPTSIALLLSKYNRKFKHVTRVMVYMLTNICSKVLATTRHTTAQYYNKKCRVACHFLLLNSIAVLRPLTHHHQQWILRRQLLRIELFKRSNHSCNLCEC